MNISICCRMDDVFEDCAIPSSKAYQAAKEIQNRTTTKIRRLLTFRMAVERAGGMLFTSSLIAGNRVAACPTRKPTSFQHRHIRMDAIQPPSCHPTHMYRASDEVHNIIGPLVQPTHPRFLLLIGRLFGMWWWLQAGKNGDQATH